MMRNTRGNDERATALIDFHALKLLKISHFDGASNQQTSVPINWIGRV